ncbi:DUF1810 domain-containing protein [Chelatococcus asaccharovorans]|uniref:Uncharacterized protein (DUF1810 family) n=1 Tax=Chelatococcus asaccharovorans TaxID=28210 RepID=A0A2V3TXE7_9HYPH|nr:DUF1810 domain-containing protein [Chelatococcus asaccharovorans]MBS7706818.1 DUF1810 domain-containing protein [Chelatococcus asaccharovorans]PXW54036.1 uncharacterized protein (DUF1810 family) [Chelatococcus asaccharovorans]
MSNSDPFDLTRFVEAQVGVFDVALAELRSGRKASHWMWFIFPQLRGLGHSPRAQFYGLASLEEASAYLAHPLLGPRLLSATDAVLQHASLTAHAIFGSPDDVKFHASMTLFARASGDPKAPFEEAIAAFYGGIPHPGTLDLLAH